MKMRVVISIIHEVCTSQTELKCNKKQDPHENAGRFS